MEPVQNLSEGQITTLRHAISARMSGKRLSHTLGVEKEILRLGALFLPKDLLRLRAAALLHDITKELTVAQQQALCTQNGVILSEEALLSPKTLHALTAVFVIRTEFCDFADPVILDAIRNHTTGAPHMSLFAKLLYLADYVEETRTYPDCVALRRAFWEPIAEMAEEQRLLHLDRVLLLSFDMTIKALIKEGSVIAPATIYTRNSLIAEISRHKV